MKSALLLLREAFQEILSGWRQALRIFWVLPICLVALAVAFAPVADFLIQGNDWVLLPLIVAFAIPGTTLFGAAAIAWHRHLILHEAHAALLPRLGPGVAGYTWRLMLLSSIYIATAIAMSALIADLLLPILGAIFGGDMPLWFDLVMSIDAKSNSYHLVQNAATVSIFVLIFRRMLLKLPTLALAKARPEKRLAAPAGLRRALFFVYLAPSLLKLGHSFLYDWIGGFSYFGGFIDLIVFACLPVFLFALGVSVLSVAYRSSLSTGQP